MKNLRKAFGNEGERLVKEHLEKQGYIHIVSNYTVRGGEIDLIMRQGDTVAFIEVKTRSLESAKRFGRGAAAVNEEKIRHISYCASRFISENPELCDGASFRFDVAEIYRDNAGRLYFRYYENAFMAPSGELRF